MPLWCRDEDKNRPDDPKTVAVGARKMLSALMIHNDHLRPVPVIMHESLIIVSRPIRLTLRLRQYVSYKYS